MKEHILKAFWHKTRKAFLPWTTQEIARRVNAYPEIASIELRGLAGCGLVVGKRPNHASEATTWNLTEAGKIEARAILAAEAFAKGGAA